MMRRFLILFSLIAIVLAGCKDETSEIGDKYYSKGNYKKAVESYTEYISLNPEHLKSIYNRGRAYEELGEYEKAMEDFKNVLKRDPNNVSALLSVANDFYTRKKDYENAIFYADKAISIDQKNAYAYTMMGRSYQKLGKLSEAMESYNNAISVDEKYAEAFISRGSLRLVTKQKSRACSDFKTAAAFGSEQGEELLKKYCK